MKSEEESHQSPPDDVNLNDLDLTNPQNFNIIVEVSESKRRHISTARDNLKKIKTDAHEADSAVTLAVFSEENKILDAQKEVDDINTKIFTSWGQILQNINSNLSDIKKDQTEMNKNITDIKNDQTKMNKNITDMKKDQNKMKKEQTEMNRKIDGMEKGFGSIKADVRWLLNREQFREGSTFHEISFTVGEKPDDLLTISTIADINSLSLEQVKTFLAGYGESTRGNELMLKKRLASLHAITGVHLNAIKTMTEN